MNTLGNSVIAPETLLGHSLNSFLKGVQGCEIRMKVLKNGFFRYIYVWLMVIEKAVPCQKKKKERKKGMSWHEC